MTSLETPEPNPFEDVWVYAYYPLNDSISDANDKVIHNIMREHAGVFVGSGAMMVGSRERDIQYRMKRRHAERAAHLLSQRGYRTAIREIPLFQHRGEK
jgi:hypothetical protein